MKNHSACLGCLILWRLCLTHLFPTYLFVLSLIIFLNYLFIQRSFQLDGAQEFSVQNCECYHWEFQIGSDPSQLWSRIMDSLFQEGLTVTTNDLAKCSSGIMQMKCFAHWTLANILVSQLMLWHGAFLFSLSHWLPSCYLIKLTLHLYI